MADATAAVPPAAEQQAEPQEENSAYLQAFLRWLLANGVDGIGREDSKIALFEGEGGERGLVSLQIISAGETVMRLGTRLAITNDTASEGDDKDEQYTEANEQPWSIRLAGLLLSMVQQGDQCPWQPYLNVLPKAVPSPPITFSWEDVQAIEYEPMRRQLDHASWLSTSVCQLDRSFTREQWEWALSVVHSRTFGAPGRSSAGGMGVRMLVPLVDMLNHAGDCVTSPPGTAPPTVQALDNVRWDLKPPSSPDGEWEMHVTATRDIAAGEELLLSYGERSNDDFALHYGFVPPRNPHDDVALFTDIEEGIDWWLDSFLPVGSTQPQRLQLVINAAYGAAEQEEGGTAAAEAVLAAVPEAEAEVIRAQLSKIKLSAGGMVDGRLLAAFRTLYEAVAQQQQAQPQQAQQSAQQQQPQAEQQREQGQQQKEDDGAERERSVGVGVAALGSSWQEHMRLAVGLRCRQLLKGMPTPLLDDLQRLAAWEQQTGQQQHSWGAALAHYGAAVAACEARHGGVLGRGDGAEGTGLQDTAASTKIGSNTSSSSEGGSGSGSVRGAAPPPVTPMLDAGAMSAADAALLQQLQQQQAFEAGTSQPSDAADSDSDSVGASDTISSAGNTLPVLFRCYKKMVLWDALLLSAE